MQCPTINASVMTVEQHGLCLLWRIKTGKLNIREHLVAAHSELVNYGQVFRYSRNRSHVVEDDVMCYFTHRDSRSELRKLV